MAYNYDLTDGAGFHIREGQDESTPSAQTVNWLRYGEKQWQRFAVWEPNGTSPTTTNGRCAVFIHGGSLLGVVGAQALGGSSARGYLEQAGTFPARVTGDDLDSFLVSIEWSPGDFLDQGTENQHQYQDFEFFPAQVWDVVLAIKYLRDHATDESIWGTGNSIDPDKIWIYASSQGSVFTMLVQLLLDYMTDSEAGGVGGYPGLDGHPKYSYASSHRVPVCILNIPFLDYTQAGTGLTLNDTWFFQFGSDTDWASYPNALKRQASPWWHLVSYRDDPGANKDLHWMVLYNTAATSSWTWDPGVVDNSATDYHDWIQAQPLQDELVYQGLANTSGNGACEVWSNQSFVGGNPALTNGLNDYAAASGGSIENEIVRFVNAHL